MLLFVATWTIELFAVQWYTLVFPNEIGPQVRDVVRRRFASLIDLLFIGGLTFALRRRWLCRALDAVVLRVPGPADVLQVLSQAPVATLTIMTSLARGADGRRLCAGRVSEAGGRLCC